MPKDDPRVEALNHSLRRFAEAWAEGEAETLDALLSPTYTHNDANGAHHGRAQWLAYARQRAGRTTRIDFRDVQSRILGDVAIVTGFNDIHGGGALGPTDAKDRSLLFLQVWIWHGDRWLREAFQATFLPGSDF